ncbi:cyclopropane-fatty-acyl-phospholipid synthase family protein [Halomicrobium sp. HM KBTZ05]|uniref:SAM-dependent methyltransferase n=1 Tax=Halomicrobium sp. HM KBTZ05 TaxID=3242663 RepID=UPI0035567701
MVQDVITNSVEQYYTDTHDLYQESMDTNDHASIHYGYFDREHTSRETAVQNMNRVLANIADIDKDDRVLHCGCGIGGPATWLAKNRGADVVGININEMQLSKAEHLAEKRGVTDQADFRYDDHTEMETIEDDSIDVVWGLEAVCYAEDKRDFIEQARRVLRDGGRLVVADGYMVRDHLSVREKTLMRKWLDGWKVPNLAHVDEFEEGLHEYGFSNVEMHCNDENVMPFSRGTFLRSFPRYAKAKLGQLRGEVSQTEVDHIVGCHYQYRALRKGLWSHQTAYGEIPE